MTQGGPVINFHGGDESTGNVFAVETLAPGGYLLEQHSHDHAHLSVLAVGVADVTVDGATTRHEGPCVITIPAGKVHEVRAVTPIAWYCLWAGDLAPRERAAESLKLVSGR